MATDGAINRVPPPIAWHLPCVRELPHFPPLCATSGHSSAQGWAVNGQIATRAPGPPADPYRVAGGTRAHTPTRRRARSARHGRERRTFTVALPRDGSAGSLV